FQLTYQEVGFLANGTWSTVFDVGYADGLTRPDTEIDVYDSTGKLIYVGRNSNVTDQQPQPGMGQDTTNLSHSSFGTLDPYIGPAQLPAGSNNNPGVSTYYVAIHSSATLPTALDATFGSGSTNYLTRLEPVDSTNRVVEDHVGTQGGQTAQNPSSLTPLWGTSGGPLVDPFDPNEGAQTGTTEQLNTYAAPFNLSDVSLYVTEPGNSGHLLTVDPFTGAFETDQGQMTGLAAAQSINTLAMRDDGELYGMTSGSNDGNTGVYEQINTGTGALSQAGATGIQTEDYNNSNPPGVVNQNIGLQINAMAYVQDQTFPGENTNDVDQSRSLYAIGSYAGGNFSPAYADLLYRLNPDTGAVLVPNNPGAINFNAKNAVPPTQPVPVYIMYQGQPLTEKLTGMAYINGNMYAIGNEGDLYIIGLQTIGIGAVNSINN
ncbi:MAG: hypothetical protein ACREHD_24370, partial [Pirellulales bacterium]